MDEIDDFQNDEEADEQEIQELIAELQRQIQEEDSVYLEDDDFENIILYALQKFDFELADTALEYAIKLYPFDSYFPLLRVKRLLLSFDFDNAEKLLQEIGEKFPPTSEYYLEKVLLGRMKGDEHDTLELLRLAEELDPEDPEILTQLAYEYIKKRKIKRAAAYVATAMRVDDTVDEQFFTFSYLFEDTKQYDDALQFFTILTDQFPLSKGAWFGLALAYSCLKEHEKAIEANRFVLSIDPDTSTAYYNIANSYFEMEQFVTARENYEQACKIDPDDFVALSGIGDCYYFENRFEEALGIYRKVLLMEPHHAPAILGTLHVYKALDKMDEADLFIEKAFSMSSQSFDLLCAIIPFYQADKQEEKFKRLFAHTYDQAVNKEDFFHVFTLFCCNSAQYELGIEMLSDYLDENEGGGVIAYCLAALHYLNNDISQGNKYLSVALLVDYDRHEDFLSLDPLLQTFPEISELIEMYKPL